MSEFLQKPVKLQGKGLSTQSLSNLRWLHGENPYGPLFTNVRGTRFGKEGPRDPRARILLYSSYPLHVSTYVTWASFTPSALPRGPHCDWRTGERSNKGILKGSQAGLRGHTMKLPTYILLARRGSDESMEATSRKITCPERYVITAIRLVG